MKSMKSTGLQPKHDKESHIAGKLQWFKCETELLLPASRAIFQIRRYSVYMQKLQLVVVPSLASGYSKSTGLNQAKRLSRRAREDSVWKMRQAALEEPPRQDQDRTKGDRRASFRVFEALS